MLYLKRRYIFQGPSIWVSTFCTGPRPHHLKNPLHPPQPAIPRKRLGSQRQWSQALKLLETLRSHRGSKATLGPMSDPSWSLGGSWWPHNFRQQFILVKTQIYRQQQSAIQLLFFEGVWCFFSGTEGVNWTKRWFCSDSDVSINIHVCICLSASDVCVFLGPDVAVTLWKTPISQESSDHDMTGILANPKLCLANPNMAINLHLPDAFLEILLAFLVLWVKSWMLVGGFKCFLYFPPEPWGNDPTWRAFFQTGWFNHQLERHNHCTLKIQES